MKPIFINLRFFHRLNLIITFTFIIIASSAAGLTTTFIAPKYTDMKEVVWYVFVTLGIMTSLAFYILDTKDAIEQRQEVI